MMTPISDKYREYGRVTLRLLMNYVVYACCSLGERCSNRQTDLISEVGEPVGGYCVWVDGGISRY